MSDQPACPKTISPSTYMTLRNDNYGKPLFVWKSPPPQPCIGSKCAAWGRDGDTDRGECGLSDGGYLFPDPANPTD